MLAEDCSPKISGDIFFGLWSVAIAFDSDHALIPRISTGAGAMTMT